MAAITVAALSYLGSETQRPVDSSAPVGSAFPGPAPDEAADPLGGDRPPMPPAPPAPHGADPLAPPQPPVPAAPAGPNSEALSDPLAPPQESFGEDAYENAFLAASSSWVDPGGDSGGGPAQASEAESGFEGQDGEWHGEKAEESTLSADMAAIMDEDEDEAPPPPPQGPAFSGPPPQGDPHDAPPPPAPGPDDDYRL